MAIDTITPAADSVIENGASLSFKVDDTYTTITIEVETSGGYEYAYDGALGGAQTGYTVSIVASGGRHTFTVSRNAGFDLSPFNFRVVENETGSAATTTTSYVLSAEQPYPQGQQPYNAAGVAANVTSFEGRTGTVVSAASDYDASEIDNDSSVAGAFVDDALNQLDTDVATNSARAPLSGAGAPGVSTGNGKNVGHIYVDTTNDDAYTLVDATVGANVWSSGGGSGDVVGPATSVDNSVALFDGGTGKLLQGGLEFVYASGQLRLSHATTASLRIKESASAPAAAGSFGYLWIKSDLPNTLWFTDDAGVDFQLGVGATDHGALTGLADDDHTQYHTDARGDARYGPISLTPGWNGTLLESASIVVTSDGVTITLSIEKNGGGDLTAQFDGVLYAYDTSPADTIVIPPGTDTVPVQTHIWLSEAAGTISLNTGTAFPATAFCAVATVVAQSAATLQTDGPLKVHAWTDHVASTDQGHIHHLSRWIRTQPATWTSGCAAGSMVVSSPDAYLSVATGSVYQLHPHSFPALDMQTGDPLYVVNDPTTPYKRITTLDDVTQDAVGGAINNRWFPLVVWGSVNEQSGDCKIFVNLPTGSYVSAAKAVTDDDAYGVYSIPSAFTGCGFLIAAYVVQGKASGAWVEDSIQDLRGLFPSVAAGGGAGITDHGDLAGLADDDHTQYVLGAGTRAQDAAFFTERADHVNTFPDAGKAELWVKNTADQQPMFTNDAGDDQNFLMEDPTYPNSNTYAIPFATGADGRLGFTSVFTRSLIGGTLVNSGSVQLIAAGNGLVMKEGASSSYTPAATYGNIWVKTGAPNVPMFTDDAGTDHQIDGDVVGPGSATDNRIVTWDGASGALVQDSVVGLEPTTGVMTNIGTEAMLVLAEQTGAAPTHSAGYGKIWVDNTAPTSLMFTDDVSTDHPVVLAPTSVTDDRIVTWDGTTGHYVQSTAIAVSDNGAITMTGSDNKIEMVERGTAPTNSAGYGKFWVKSDAPTTPWFTDDVSGDYQLGDVVGAASSLDTAVALYADSTGKTLKYEAGLAFTGGQLRLGSASASMRMLERASAPADAATFGYFWVRNDAPNVPMFTDDASGDTRLNKELSITLASNELVSLDATEVVIGGAYIDGSTGGTYSWEILGTYNDNGGTGVQDMEVRLYDRGPDGTPVAGVLRSVIEITSLDTLDRVSQALTVASSPGVDADQIDSDEPRLMEVRVYMDCGGGNLDSGHVLSCRFIES